MIGPGEISFKILLVRIVENNEIDDYLGQVRLRSKDNFAPQT